MSGRAANVRRMCGFVAVLGVIAFFAGPHPPDGNFYEAATDRRILPGCAEIQCFRVLVPWALGVLPLASLLKWKAFAVLCDALAAMAVFDLCLALGLPQRVASTASWLSALGFGSLYALFETFTPDPLMFWLAPAVTKWLLDDRLVLAAFATYIGVFAKEFVVVAVATCAVWAAWAGQWRVARTALATAAVAFLLWAALQLILMRAFRYSYSGSATNSAANLLSGSYLAVWVSHMSPSAALSALFSEFGALYLLMPIGWFAAPRALKQLTIAALPFAAFLAYVEQPDRALWNFHYLASPLAAIALADVPAVLRWTFVALYATANLRVGAQIGFVPPAKFALAASVALAAVTIVLHYRRMSGEVSLSAT